jgi:DNA ligase-associated metallophosphoesterase
MLSVEVTIAGEQLVLHPWRALYWPRMRWTVVSDLHLGKAAHLRKGGAALPEGHDARTLQRLDRVLADHPSERVLFLGDLFHSAHNHAWERFVEWAHGRTEHLHLVPGNHDVLALRRYEEARLQMCADALEEGPFIFAHEPFERQGCYVIGGHVHPGVLLLGQGRQNLRLPCFRFGPHTAILPAFGSSTGLHLQDPGPHDRIHALTDRAVIDVSDAVVRGAAHRR